MKNFEEFKNIWKIAEKRAKNASNFISADKSFSRGGLIILDKRKKFTKWVIKTKQGVVIEGGAYVTGKAGYYYLQNSAYCAEFCSVLEKNNIRCKNDVNLD